MESDVNVKADLELTLLHEKMDKLTGEQLTEIHQKKLAFALDTAT